MQRVIYLRRPRAHDDRQGLQQHLERIFQRQWGQPMSVIIISKHREIWRPPTDVYETNDTFVVKVELPGMRDAEIEVTLDERSLRISGTRPEQRDSNLQCYHQTDINYGRFELEVFLARQIDYDNVTAHYDDGFLVVELPKPAAEPKNPPIRVQIAE